MTTEKRDVAIWEKQLVLAQPKLLSLLEDPKKTKIEVGFAHQIIAQNSALQKCSPLTIFHAIVNIGRLGITLNTSLDLAYLIPHKGKCVLRLSYKGMREILVQSGAVKEVRATVVFRDEWEAGLFKILEGNTREIVHTPNLDFPTSKEFQNRVPFLIYSVAELFNGYKSVEYMTMGEILGIAEQSSESLKSGKETPYKVPAFRLEMLKKTVLRRHYKALPKTNISDRALLAYEVDNQDAEAEFGFKEKRRKPNSQFIDPTYMGDPETVDIPYEEVDASAGFIRCINPCIVYSDDIEIHLKLGDVLELKEDGFYAPDYDHNPIEIIDLDPANFEPYVA
jgi:phage RecT family recombinase